MRNLTGYFLVGSKPGGRIRKPWTLVLSAAVNQKDSRGARSSWERRASLGWVSFWSINQSAFVHVKSTPSIEPDPCFVVRAKRTISPGSARSEEHTSELQ